MEAVADSEDAELRQSLQWTERVLSNFFVETCDALTIAYWEALLSINPEPGQTLEERRTIVMATLNARKPITMISVREMMDNIFGAGNYVFKIDENNPLKVVIGLEGASYSQQTSFLSWFYKVCPAHLLINLTNQQTLSNSNYISAFGAPMVTARASFTIPQTQELDIDCYWGDNVTIPAGYTVQSVKTTVLYLDLTPIDPYSVSPYDKLYMQVQGTARDDFTTLGITTQYIGLGILPCLSIFIITNISNPSSFTGYTMTTRTGQTAANAPSEVSGIDVNSNGYVLNFSAKYSNAATYSMYTMFRSAKNNNKHLMGRIRLYDANNTLQNYCFDLPTSLWSFSGGAFSWLDDSTQSDPNNLKFYYTNNGNTPIRIHCISTGPQPEPTNYIEILVGIRWYTSTNSWLAKEFAANDYWYAGIMNTTDRQRVLDFMDNQLGNIGSEYVGQYGSPAYIPMDYEYTPVALYADENGTQLVTSDMSNFHCGYYNVGQTGLFPVTIESIYAFTTPCKTWKLRITKR